MPKRFKYIGDPLFIIATLLYVFNKSSLLLGSRWGGMFFKYYLNDMLLVAVVLPLLLKASRLLGFRSNDFPPRLVEVVVPVVIWTLAFEIVGPTYFSRGTSDPLDVAAYLLGGIVSWVVWNRSYQRLAVWGTKATTGMNDLK